MDLNALTTIVWFISAFFFLINTLFFVMGKRIIKQSRVILDTINLLIMLYLFQQVSNYSISIRYLLLAVISVFLISIVKGFFTGDYKVHTENKEILLKSVDSAIASVMAIRAVKQEKKDSIFFILEESNKKIEVKETVTISDKKIYRLKFKRWYNHDLKKQILTQINSELENYEDLPVDKQVIAMKIGGSILLMIICLFITSYFVMDRWAINFEMEPVPNELYFTDQHFRYEDEEVIYKIHENLQNTYSHKSKFVTQDEAIKESKYIFQYGIGGKTIYIGQERAYIYVPDSETGNRSPLHWICWKIHNIYDRSEGVYYIRYRGKELFEIIEEIITQR